MILGRNTQIQHKQLQKASNATIFGQSLILIPQDTEDIGSTPTWDALFIEVILNPVKHKWYLLPRLSEATNDSFL